MLNEEKIKNIVNALEGLTYAEWVKIKSLVDQKYSPNISKVKLTDTEGLSKLIKLELLGIVP